MHHKGAESLITNSGRGLTRQPCGCEPISNTATTIGFKEKIIPKNPLLQMSVVATVGLRALDKDLQVSDGISQTYLLCDRIFAFHMTLAVQQHHTEKEHELCWEPVLITMTHLISLPTEMILSVKPAVALEISVQRVLFNSSRLEKSHIKMLLKINLDRQRPGVNQV